MESKTELFEKVRPYCSKILIKLGYTPEDYFGEIYICLMTAIKKWNPEKASLEKYVGYRLRAHMQEVRRKEKLVVSTQKDYHYGVDTKAKTVHVTDAYFEVLVNEYYLGVELPYDENMHSNT